jgi:hypothetical protein
VVFAGRPRAGRNPNAICSVIIYASARGPGLQPVAPHHHRRGVAPRRPHAGGGGGWSLWLVNIGTAPTRVRLPNPFWIPRFGFGSEILEQKFDGIVVPRLWVQIVPQIQPFVARI